MIAWETFVRFAYWCAYHSPWGRAINAVSGTRAGRTFNDAIDGLIDRLSGWSRRAR